MRRALLAAAAALGALAFAGGGAAAPKPDSPPVSVCTSGAAYLDSGELDKAIDGYLKGLDDNAPPCVDEGLHAAAAAARLEARYCAQGDDLAAAGNEDAALRRYDLALRVNVASECAVLGLTELSPASSGSKSRWDRFFDYLPTFPVQLASVALMLLTAFVFLGLVRSLLLRKASLVVRPFADDGVEPSVGSAFGGMIEEQLVRVWRTRQGFLEDGYNLDLVVADVELLSADEDLDDAVGQLAAVPQFGIVAALVGYIDHLFLQRQLAASGALLPEGAKGCGVTVSLYNRKKLQARDTLWERPSNDATATVPAEGGAPAVSTTTKLGSTEDAPAADDSAAPTPEVSRYYDLAAPVAAWVQYEAARALDARVGLITASAESFSRLTAGIDEHRAAALDRDDNDKLYGRAAGLYGEALAFDPENVAALVDQAVLCARSDCDFSAAVANLEKARSILDRRYAQVTPNRTPTRKREELADPTPYRIRYGLGAQRLHSGDSEGALRDAKALIESTSAVLAEIGWRWVGRRPPWFASWYKRAPAWLWRAVRRFFRRPRRRTIVGDWELAKFLADTVEPAAVALWWSARVADKKKMTAPPNKKLPPRKPLDRRAPIDDAWLRAYLDELAAGQRKRSALARALAWLGVSRWRPPREPTYRVQYNLACLFSRLAVALETSALFDRSAACLEQSLAGATGPRRGEAARWALRDPGLAALYHRDNGKFKEIVDLRRLDASAPASVSSTGHIRLRNSIALALWLAVVVAAAVVYARFYDLPLM